MIGSILNGAVRLRWLVLFLTAVVATVGAWQLNLLPIDVTPDITNKQVQINTVVPTLSPVEVEKRVTYPIETALSGLNGVESTRSFSRNGFSQVTVIFKESANLYFMRQQVSERLAQARPSLPEGAEPQMGPVSTGLGEVFHYSVEYAHPDGKGATIKDGLPGWRSDGSFLTDRGERLTDQVSKLAYLRTVQDWIVRPQLRTTPGVADVDSLGGYVKQYVVEPDAAKLQILNLAVKLSLGGMGSDGASIVSGEHAVQPLLKEKKMLATVDQFGQQMAANAIDKALGVLAVGAPLKGWVKTDIKLVTSDDVK